MADAEARKRNLADLQDVSVRLGRVRDKLATVMAEAGPLFRESVELTDKLNGILAQLPAPEPVPAMDTRAAKEQEAMEFEGAPDG